MINLSKKNFTWIQDELENGEIVTWAGQSFSKKSFSLRFNLLFIIVVVVLFISLVPLNFGIYTVFFTLLFFISTKGDHKSKNSIYLITNTRVLILDDMSIKSFTSYYPYHLQNLEKQINDDGSGNIMFTTNSFINNLQNDSVEKVGLIGVNDVNKVGDLLDKLAYGRDF